MEEIIIITSIPDKTTGMTRVGGALVGAMGTTGITGAITQHIGEATTTMACRSTTPVVIIGLIISRLITQYTI